MAHGAVSHVLAQGSMGTLFLWCHLVLFQVQDAQARAEGPKRVSHVQNFYGGCQLCHISFL